MFRKSLMSVAFLAVAACGPTSEEAFRAGLPSREMVEVKTPGATSAQGLDGETKGALALGQTSEFFAFTLGASVTVNGATVAVLRLVEDITQHPPTRIDGDVAVWGPHSGALDPNAWRLTVTRTGAHTFTWALDAKAEADPDTSFRTVLSGEHTTATDDAGEPLRHFGEGSFLVDWDTAGTLPRHDANVGTFQVTYRRPAPGAEVRVDASFRNVRDEEHVGQTTSADYRFAAVPGQGGTLEFAVSKDYVKATSATERLAIKSRWTETGAGRADVTLSGGDLANPATGSDCWDGAFKSVYSQASYDPAKNYGTESACAFVPASYSTL